MTALKTKADLTKAAQLNKRRRHLMYWAEMLPRHDTKVATWRAQIEACEREIRALGFEPDPL